MTESYTLIFFEKIQAKPLFFSLFLLKLNDMNLNLTVCFFIADFKKEIIFLNADLKISIEKTHS